MKQYPMMEWTPEKVSKFWDFQSQFPQSYFAYQVGKSVVKRMEWFLPKRGTVLDYGCGAGYLIRHLLDKGYKAAGLDFSGKSVEETRLRAQGSENFLGAFLLGEILAKGMKFDAIFVLEVMEHLNDEYLALTLRNLKSLLAEGGVVIFSTPNEEKLEDSHVLCPHCDQVFHRWQHMRSWSKESLSGFLEENGFHPTTAFTTCFSDMPGNMFYVTLKRFLKRLLGKTPDKDLNLVCVCSLAR